LSQVNKVSGQPGKYRIDITIHPRYVNENCTACGDCEKVCPIEIPDDFNYGLSHTRAIYLPYPMCFPKLYVIAPAFARDERMKTCQDACKYNAIDLNMSANNVVLEASTIIWTTGWTPYDATKIDNLGFGQIPDVITNVMVERLAAPDGPTAGKILRPSDGSEISSIAFVQCAGSRDENHLPYCSGVCCLASMKQATYIRNNYKEADIHIFYIDIRAFGRNEDFYTQLQADPKIHFHRGKAAKVQVTENRKIELTAEDTLTGKLQKVIVDMVVLATGMVPNLFKPAEIPNLKTDPNGFLCSNEGIFTAGVCANPVDVASCVQDATNAVIKSLQFMNGGR
jgi:heterodisulfide reductase subunit A-like polyferredoxin